MHLLSPLATYSHHRLGVSWWIDDTMTPIEGVPCLWALKRSRAAPKGTGAKVLSVICKALDRLKQPICLIAVNDRLIEYYQQFGFFLVAGENPRLMLRVPS